MYGLDAALLYAYRFGSVKERGGQSTAP